MLIEHTIGKHTFKIICDIDDIYNSIESEKDEFEENIFVEYGITEHEETLDEEQYIRNVEEMKNEFEEMLEKENLIELINKAEKKKNGTLYRNRVVKEIPCNNCTFITDWNNTWIYRRIKVKSIDDNTLEITCDMKTDTPV